MSNFNQNQSTKSYFNQTLDGVGYLNRIECIKPEPTEITGHSDAMQQLDDLIVLQMGGKAFDANLSGASLISWVERYRVYVEFETELRVWDQQQPRDSETRILDATMPKLHRLETQVIQLSSTCVQQHVELKRLRGYFDPQYDALSVIGMTAVTFVRALGALFFQVARVGSFRSPAPQAVRVKQNG